MDSYQSSDQEEDAQGGSADEGQGDGNNTIKRTRRLAMNRVTARERRKRKRQQLEELAIQAENLKVLNASIQQDNGELRARIRQLSAAVAAVGDVSAPTTNNSMPIPMPMPTSLPSSTGGTSAFITGSRAVPSRDFVQLLLEQQNRIRMGLAMPSDDFLQPPPPSQTRTSVESGASSDIKNSNSYAHLISHAANNPSVMLQLQQSTQQRNGSASTFGNDSLFSSLLEQHHQTSRQDSEASASGMYQQQRQNIQSSLQPPPPNVNRGHAANRFSSMASSNNSNPSSSSNPSCNEMLIQQWIRERQSQNNQPK